MSKKDLASVTADLSALASQMPTQRPAPTPAVSLVASQPASAEPISPAKLKAERGGEGEEITQFSLSMRKGLRKQLSRLADDADMTMRAFVLNALKAKGLDVRPDDLLDLRKDRR